MSRTLVFAFLISRLAIGLLLLSSGIFKAASVTEFKKALVAHDILPERIVSALSVAIPLIELLTGFTLLLNALNPFAEWIACCLFISFGMFIGSSLIRGKDHIACGCFGSRSGKISWLLVWRNTALAGVSLLGAGRFFLAGGLLLLPLLFSWAGAVAGKNAIGHSQSRASGDGIVRSA